MDKHDWLAQRYNQLVMTLTEGPPQLTLVFDGT